MNQVYIKVSCTQELAGAVEHFCELLADVESEDMASLEHGDVEKILFEKGTETLRRLYQGHLDLRERREEKYESVVGSDQVERNHRRTGCERDLMTLFGEVAVRRLGYSCRGSGSLFPLDAELNLPTDKFSHGLHERVALEVVKGSFEQASLSIERTTRGKVAKRQTEELAVAVSTDFEAFYKSKRKERHAPSDDLLIISVDGKGIVMRPESLREVTRKSAEKQNHKLQTRLSKGEKRNRKRMATVATVYSIERHERTAESIMGNDEETNESERPRATDKRVWASVENNSERVIQEAFEEALSKDPKQKRQWVVLVDGQEQQIKYIKSCAKRLGVRVTLVLDFIHVLEYLWKAAYCFEAEGSEAAEESVRARALNILHGNAGNVAAGIRRSATLRGLSEQERAAADNSADYLLKYTDMMRYDQYLADGFPIATGVIEGACRHLIKDRMDITGARWGLETAEAVLKLRSLYTSGDLTNIFSTTRRLGSSVFTVHATRPIHSCKAPDRSLRRSRTQLIWTNMTLTPKQQVKRFLLTGDHDVQPLGWGGDWITSGKKANQAMREALIEEVLHRAKGLSPATIPAMDHHAFTRNKVAPMVNGLFPETERENILVMLEKSVVFLTDESIVNVLQHVHWPRTAWNLANLYLLSIGGKPLGKKASKIVGLSEETTCYVSHEYFVHQSRFADFVVHEAAHVFHNCKRFTVGLPETRTKEFLLNIDFHQRETFAYACEVYSRMLELADSRTERMSLLQEIRDEFVPPDDHVDMDKFQNALAAAASATNGWKKILHTCAPAKPLKPVSTNG